MAKSKAKLKNQGLLYPLIVIIPAVILIACGIIFKSKAMIPFILAYAFIAVLPAFFLASKKYGMAIIITSIVFVVGLTGYIVTDNMLQKSSLFTDKAIINAISEAFNKPPALISQKDLDKVKVLVLDTNIAKFEEQNFYAISGYTLSLGYDDVLELIKKQEDEAEHNHDDDEETEDGEPTIDSLMKSADSSEPINDFSDLAAFKNLEYLLIQGPNLEYLNQIEYYGQLYKEIYGDSLGYNVYYNWNPMIGLKDLSFAENMNSLKNVTVYNTGATDFTPFSNLTSIVNLNIQYCTIDDASGLSNLTNLETLNLYRTGISDISFVAPLVKLNALYLGGNEIKDISPLKNLVNLKNLTLNSFSDSETEEDKINDISALSGLVNLENINLNYNNITDISALSKLDSLESIYLKGNEIENISPVFSLPSIKYIDISENRLFALSDITASESLETLVADNNFLSDLTPVASLKNLTRLSLAGNMITDISPLISLENLTDLSVGQNMIPEEAFGYFDALEEAGTLSLSGRDSQLIDSDDDYDYDEDGDDHEGHDHD